MPIDQHLVHFWRASTLASNKRGKGGQRVIDILPQPPGIEEKLTYMKFQVTEFERQHILGCVPKWALFKGGRESADAVALRCLTRGLCSDRELPQWFQPLRSQELAIESPSAMKADDYAVIMDQYANDLDVRLRRAHHKSVANKKVLSAAWLEC